MSDLLQRIEALEAAHQTQGVAGGIHRFV